MKRAELGYSKQTKTIELVVPNGTKMADLPKIIAGLNSGGFVGRLPRGCNTCTSGDHFTVREELADVINVDLENFKATEKNV
ncbi:MAG: hypothetical protein WA419_17020 [Silvibacterium sp.]